MPGSDRVGSRCLNIWKTWGTEWPRGARSEFRVGRSTDGQMTLSKVRRAHSGILDLKNQFPQRGTRRRSGCRAGGGRGRTLRGPRGGSLGSRDEFVGIDHGPTELPQGGLETMASLHSPPLYSSKRVMGLPPLPFTTVEDDPYIAPVLKVPAQRLEPIQPAAGDYEEEHVSSRINAGLICHFPGGLCESTLPPSLSFWRWVGSRPAQFSGRGPSPSLRWRTGSRWRPSWRASGLRARRRCGCLPA